MPNRFVILHHRLGASEHWDLMLEKGDVLATWQLLKDPTGPDPFPIPARRIGDHRTDYLIYEGPLSEGRGHVHRVDRGDLELHTLAADMCAFSADGTILRGRFELRRQADDSWLLEPNGLPD